MIEPQLEVLRYLPLTKINATHLAHLPGLAASNWNGVTAEDIVDELRMGKVAMWEVKGSVDGIVLTRLEDSPRERTLYLDGVAGRGTLRRCQAIGRDLRLLAVGYSAHRIQSATRDPRWQAVGRRLGFAPVSTVYSMEVQYGQGR
jgi:hypothetical protein